MTSPTPPTSPQTSTPPRLQPVPAPVPRDRRPRPRGRIAPRARRLLQHFWVVPALWCTAAVLLGLAVPHLDTTWLAGHLPFLFPGDVEGARTVLSTIAGAMISVTGLVFSNTMVVLQLAGTQYSPRVITTFLHDRVTQHTLGLFAACFVYALTVLRALADSGGAAADGVPQVAVTLGYALVLASVAMFLTFIHHITSSIGVGSVLRATARSTRALLERSQECAPLVPRADEQPALPELGAPHVVIAPRSGHLDAIDVEALCREATREGARVEVLHPLGTFVVEGGPLALVHGADAATDWAHAVTRHLDLADERTLGQDVSFGVRRLVDIAERALSPGVNDPTTAVQVLDQLHDLLRRMASAEDHWPVHSDDEGVVRVVTRERSFADHLDLALDEICHWGESSLQVPARVESLLADLEAAATAAHRPVVAAKRAALAGARGGSS